MRRFLTLSALVVIAACDAPMHGSEFEPASPAPPLVLTGADGARFDLAERQGDLVVLFFGYTHCPDVCPTVLADWARAKRMLGARADGIRFVFVSVDPERDTPEVAGRYAMQFDSSFVGLSGSPVMLERVKLDWGLAAYPEGDPRAGSYTVAHPASVYVVDRKGRLRLLIHPGAAVEDLASDLRNLL